MDLFSRGENYTPLVLYPIVIILLLIEYRRSRSQHLFVYMFIVPMYAFNMLLLMWSAYKISYLAWGLSLFLSLLMPLFLIIWLWWNRAKMTRPNHPAPFSSPAFRPTLSLMALSTVIVAAASIASFELRLCGRLDILLQRSECAAELRLGRDSAQVVAISPRDELLAAGGRNGTVKIIRIADHDLVRTINAHIDEITDLAFSPDGQWLATASVDGTTRVWNVGNGNYLYTFAAPHKHSSTEVAFSPDGSLLAVGFDGPGVQVWRMADGELVQQIPTSNAIFAFSPNGRQIAGAMDDGQAIGIWQIEDGQLVTRLAGPAAQKVSSLAYAPDGKTLATAAWGGDTIYLWQFEDQTVRALTGSLDSDTIALSPDGAYLFTSGDEVHTMGYTYLLQVRQVSDGARLYEREGFPERIKSITVSPGGSLLALSSNWGYIWLWRAPAIEDGLD